MTTYYEYLRNEKGFKGGAYTDINKASYWSFGYVESNRQLMEKAFDSVETLKASDPKSYDKYYWRVAAAYLEHLYMQLEFYGANYGRDYCAEAIDLFESICNKLSITAMNESNSLTMNSYIVKWRGTYV